MKASLVAVPLIALLLALPITANAAIAPVSPLPNALVTAQQPTFKWSLGEGEFSSLIRVSRAGAVDSEGVLLQNNSSILSEEPAMSARSYTVPKSQWSFSKGTYFWQALGYTADYQQQLVMPPVKFVVPTVLKFSGVRQRVAANSASGDLQAEFVGFTTGNLDKSCIIKLTVKRGAKVVYVQTRKQSCAAGGYRAAIFMNWPNNTVPKGTPVTATLALSGGGKTVTTPVMRFKTP
ncbi:MAG: hypothetical protein JWM90_1938 [Thermoleophilia bacterium]|nr:hypothetical protein [Thermoleophilia bacterium]